jgi:hypothetical protein
MGSIKVVFWESFVDSVEDGQTYKFTNLRVKQDFHTHEKLVNTAKEGCKVNKVNISLSEVATKQAIISVIGVKVVSKYFCCNTCSKKPEERGKIIIAVCATWNKRQQMTSGFVKFASRILHASYNLTVFHPEMVKLFQKQGKRLLSTLSTDEVEDILLDTTDL